MKPSPSRVFAADSVLPESTGGGSGNLLGLVLRDFLFEWRLSFFMILALAAVLAPLLVLFGLKFGLVETMSQRLLEDPRNRAVTPIGSGHYDPLWLEEKGSWPEVAFLLPRTRTIAATLYLRNPKKGRTPPTAVDLLPSASADPLLETKIPPPVEPDEVVLSRPCADKLDVSVGDLVEGYVTRERDKRKERARLELEVIGILPLRAMQRDVALVSLPLLVATEDYRDGYAVSMLAAEGRRVPQRPRSFAGFRMYARSIFDVPRLRDRLVTEGLEVYTRAAEIEDLQALDRNLTAVFWIVAVIGMCGYVLSLAANLWTNVERKRRDLSVLRLVGFPTSRIVLFPVLNAVLVGLLGSAVACLVYFGVQLGINRLFSQSLEQGELLVLLLPHHLVIATLGTVLSAVVASALAGYRASRIEPSEGLRDL